MFLRRIIGIAIIQRQDRHTGFLIDRIIDGFSGTAVSSEAVFRRKDTPDINTFFDQDIQDVRTILNRVSILVLAKWDKIVYRVFIYFVAVEIIDPIAENAGLIGE